MDAQYTVDDHRKWDQFLPEFTLSINTSRHESTGFTPAMLNFGKELALPSPLNKDRYNTDDPTKGIPANQDENLQKLKDIFKLVRINLGKTYQAQSKYYNLRRREWSPKVGDQVMKREHPLSSAIRNFNAKLAPKYSGPYIVECTVSPVVVEIKTLTSRKTHRVHVKDLKSAHVQTV
ncbi:hypothetical protein NQ314_018393 [Rhamnusium bicolor]|uniref:Uncharacterized protein n=1 Tax=Rhamnusium bicolor TaxID=1586634 RepID=A0AAV8WRH9_9CUCU|nr:hypothetical protein NQ314_018393 [Rhamnusium bicolor]